ncbi:MAG: aminotransferase class V-fold PLP-dependent enzyme [Anaerolineaceae bacterium]|nr:aminotransferase class V-fold PLP-dependent enzyme [Anaerolineaceae bacterium]
MNTTPVYDPHLHFTAENMAAASAEFRQSNPDYDTTRVLDDLRTREYGRLDREGHVYLDYTGGGLYAESQLREHMAFLGGNVFGNPHSKNLTSLAMTERVEQTREYVLRYFNASPDEYMVIFTPNATGALRLIGESYPFKAGDHYLLTFDNHNSVNGIREFARSKGATITYIPVLPPELRVDESALVNVLEQAQSGANNLFAYPAQSNFTGVQHPLAWIAQAQAKGWDVLVDAASFVPSNRLDLSQWHPDFVSISFYKIFGYPTGMGCLMVRKAAAAKLRRPWYAGGTITFSSVVADGHYLTPGAAGFEDGTVNYLSIPAVELGLKHIEAIGIDVIHRRVMCLTGWLIKALLSLRHSNGRPVIQLYGPPNTHMRGGTVQVNFFDREGYMIDCNRVEAMANDVRISLRAGCHCNPGAREMALGFSRDDLLPCFSDKDKLSFEQFLHVIDGKTTGALRASVGLVTTFADVYKYVQFAETFADLTLT